ncbi:sugar ABC transporter ATP-binding protein [Bradyrhizobium sp. NBAIM20]|uniref:sugar ABC transporter ATP-binding protein n=1 Tax=unclassified Bradyrhizobium TaxID=2631580 RepID=UPI001CD737CF|nr:MULTISPECIES: sugar ABC transporter ATP-binding protein [unclassified Bradyrhizobium]MCA1412597.1 sugar ABC transporter ATP-binding protein [Bradyrhizobium sp. NBAIM20]MCA1465072.1 sugar ABC transporter ATP-binding protein [Bradyrhizobium sp. NBAIM18]
MNDPILQMRGVSKTFFGIKALRAVDLTVYPGEIHALMGENGAGKSTLMKILSGAYRPDPGGEIRIEGRAVRIEGPLGGRAAGISIIYQELSLAPNLSVAENIYLGREISRSGLLARGAMREGVGPILKRLGADFLPSTLVAHLSMGQRQLVEIARALHVRSKILIMDEPTTSLSAAESERLFALIRQLRAEGLAIIYISHRMDEVYALGDRVTVLRDGRLVGSLDKPEIRADTIVRLMVGRDVSSFYKKDHDPEAGRGHPVLAAIDMADGGRVKGCSLTVHAGEVVGLAGLIGAGRTELAHLIIGASPKTSGRLELEGRPVEIRTPGEALEAGIAYLTEDRKALGLFLDMSCLDNINLAVLGRDAKLGWFLDRDKARERADRAFAGLSIRAANAGVPAGGLSGGNQQKVLLSRLLAIAPKVLILDEPTRGVDVGAKSEIYSIIDNLAKAGTAILVISSDLPEIIGICDRVIVMRAGHIAGEVSRGPHSPLAQEDIMGLATGMERLDA